MTHDIINVYFKLKIAGMVVGWLLVAILLVLAIIEIIQFYR